MKRTTPLRRSSPLPRGETPIKKRNPKKGHRFPKHVNEAYREWIRGLRCVARRPVGPPFHPLAMPCFGAVECAHVRSRGAGGQDVGNCVPLCTAHHREQHVAGIRTFARRYGLDLAAVAAELGQRYEMDGGAF